MESASLHTATEYLDALYRYAITLTGSQPDAQDLVQETFLRAGKGLSGLRPRSNLKSWMFTILRNTWLTQVRSSRKYVAIPDGHSEDGLIDLPDGNARDPLSTYVGQVKSDEVWNAIDQLTPAHREIIVLREFEDLSYSELAEVLDLPLGTIMSRLGRAREGLRERLKHWRDVELSSTKKAAQP